MYDNLRRCTPGHVKLVVFQGLWKQLSSRNIHENLSNVALTSSNACAPHNKCLRCVGVGAATGEVLLNLLRQSRSAAPLCDSEQSCCLLTSVRLFVEARRNAVVRVCELKICRVNYKSRIPSTCVLYINKEPSAQSRTWDKI